MRKTALHIGPAVVLGSLALTFAAGAARADCNEDFKKIMDRRVGEIQQLNRISKANGGKLDPMAACPRLRSLSAIESGAVEWLEKNQTWCGIPDDIGDKMKAARARDASIATQACSLAVKVQQMKKQAAQQQAAQQQEAVQKLPAGPL